MSLKQIVDDLVDFGISQLLSVEVIGSEVHAVFSSRSGKSRCGFRLYFQKDGSFEYTDSGYPGDARGWSFGRRIAEKIRKLPENTRDDLF